MQSSDNQLMWRMSKAQAAQVSLFFAVLGVAEAIAKAAHVWSTLPFILAALSGSWWCYRWYGDLQRAHSNHVVQTARQTHVQPAKTTPTMKSGLYVPDVTESPYGLDLRP